MIRILALGDVVGKAGRFIITRHLPYLRQREDIHFVIANGENLVNGRGMDSKTVQEILAAGVDVVTGGNHSFDKRESYDFIDSHSQILRPYNYPPATGAYRVPGVGYFIATISRQNALFKICLINLMGRVHMEPSLDCPFRAFDELYAKPEIRSCHGIWVDFHAEATSEKQAFFHYVKGRASWVFGTHTHVPTADERIVTINPETQPMLTRGFELKYRHTAYVSDLGMNGAYDSVIGMKADLSLGRFLSKMPTRFEPADDGAELHGVITDFDEISGEPLKTRRIEIKEA